MPSWKGSQSGVAPEWDRSERKVTSTWNLSETKSHRHRSYIEVKVKGIPTWRRKKTKRQRSVIDVNSRHEVEETWNWTRNQTGVTTKWHRMTIEIGSKWSRGEVEANSKWHWGDTEMNSRWDRSETDESWMKFTSKGNRSEPERPRSYIEVRLVRYFGVSWNLSIFHN